MDILYYFKKYYNDKPPENIEIFFLEEKDFEEKYKSLAKKIFGKINSDYINSEGYCFFDNKNNRYYILIKKFWDYESDNNYIITLFHELSHVETLPLRLFNKIEQRLNKNIDSLIGYDFWKEYIAQYEAVNKFQMIVGQAKFLTDKNMVKEHISYLKHNFDELLYEIILYSEIANVYIDEIEEESKELISLLKQIKNKFITNDERKNISIKDLEKIGKCVRIITEKYYKN